MGNEQSAAKAITTAIKKQEKGLIFRGESLEAKWISEEAGKSLKLDCLKLIDMALITIPPVIFSVTSLKQLDLSKNQLVSITGIGSLSNVTDLDLSGNRLDFLPDDLSSLTNLEFLNLSCNILTNRSFPPNLLETSKLSSIDISENNILTLSVDLAQFLLRTESITIHTNYWDIPELQSLTSDTNESLVKKIISDFLTSRTAAVAAATVAVSEKPKSSFQKMMGGGGSFKAPKPNTAEITSSQTVPAVPVAVQLNVPPPIASRKASVVARSLSAKKSNTFETSSENNLTADDIVHVRAIIPAPAPETVPTPAQQIADSQVSQEPAAVTPAFGKIAAAVQIPVVTALLPLSNPVSTPAPFDPPPRTQAFLKNASRAAGPKGRMPPSTEFIEKNANEGSLVVTPDNGQNAFVVNVVSAPAVVDGPPPSLPSKNTKPQKSARNSTAEGADGTRESETIGEDYESVRRKSNSVKVNMMPGLDMNEMKSKFAKTATVEEEVKVPILPPKNSDSKAPSLPPKGSVQGKSETMLNLGGSPVKQQEEAIPTPRKSEALESAPIVAPKRPILGRKPVETATDEPKSTPSAKPAVLLPPTRKQESLIAISKEQDETKVSEPVAVKKPPPGGVSKFGMMGSKAPVEKQSITETTSIPHSESVSPSSTITPGPSAVKPVGQKQEILTKEPDEAAPSDPPTGRKPPVGGVSMFGGMAPKTPVAKVEKPVVEATIPPQIQEDPKTQKILKKQESAAAIMSKEEQAPTAAKKPAGGISMFGMLGGGSKPAADKEKTISKESSSSRTSEIAPTPEPVAAVAAVAVEVASPTKHLKQPSGGIRLPMSAEAADARRLKVASMAGNSVMEVEADANEGSQSSPIKGPQKPDLQNKPSFQQSKSLNVVDSKPRTVAASTTDEPNSNIPQWKQELEKRKLAQQQQ